MSTGSIYRTLRQPEYTGENRCTPCTVLNVLIAGFVSALVGLASVPLAVAVFTLSMAVIYFRGYLLPGTPTLTRTYFPDRVLRWFDKDPASFGVRIEADDEVDVEAILMDVGVLEERAASEDLYLLPAFREEWDSELDRLDEDGARQQLGTMLGIDAHRISVLPRSRSFEIKVDGETAGKWESSEAFVADMAAEGVFGERVANWQDLPVEHRSGILRAVRVYLDRCPRCDGSVALEEESVKSCCRSREVLASRCRECGARLFEIETSQVEEATA